MKAVTRFYKNNKSCIECEDRGNVQHICGHEPGHRNASIPLLAPTWSGLHEKEFRGKGGRCAEE